MYSAALILHSLLRWLVLLAGFIAVLRALSGWNSGRPWTPLDNRAGVVFTGMVDLQLLIGLVLYVALSPTTRLAFQDFGEAMRTPSVRFWVMDHAAGMLFAVVLTHIGRVRVRKASTSLQRHQSATIFFGLALILILLSIPWPGMPNGRALLPF